MIFPLIGDILLAYIIFETISLVSDGMTARRLGRETVGFSRFIEHPIATIMCIGDSTAVGTGAPDTTQSIAGRLGQDYPETAIINYAVNGISSSNLVTILSTHPEWRADLLIVQIGGIDILGLRSLRTFKKNILTLIKQTRIIAPRTLFLTSSNLGSLPYFRFPISLIFAWRTRYVRNFMLHLAHTHDLVYADLYHEPRHDPFLKNPKKYFACDHIHPSGDGYGLWYTQIKTVLRAHHWDAELKNKI